jgi:hypothetical protein
VDLPPTRYINAFAISIMAKAFVNFNTWRPMDYTWSDPRESGRFYTRVRVGEHTRLKLGDEFHYRSNSEKKPVDGSHTGRKPCRLPGSERV